MTAPLPVQRSRCDDKPPLWIGPGRPPVRICCQDHWWTPAVVEAPRLRAVKA